jgi:phage/plasmid primase-like uncharacterized protein
MILAAAKAVPIERELERRGHRLKRAGRELIGACPRCGGRDRFGVNVQKQVWNCRGCARGGDVLDLVQHLDGVRLAEAVRMLTGMASGKPTRTPPTPKSDDDFGLDDDFAPTPSQSPDLLEAANRIWQAAIGIAGTEGEGYFHRRGIPLEDVPDYAGLRFHPRCTWGQGTAPCVVGRFTDAITGEPRGIWRRPIDGSKPKSLGPMSGCVIRLWPDESVTTAIVVGEGVETILAAATRCISRGALLQPAWAAASAGNLENLPVLSGIETLTILADNDEDGRGQEAAQRCADRWSKAGRETTIFTPRERGDFNDAVTREEGP